MKKPSLSKAAFSFEESYVYKNRNQSTIAIWIGKMHSAIKLNIIKPAGKKQMNHLLKR